MPVPVLQILHPYNLTYYNLQLTLIIISHIIPEIEKLNIWF